MKRQIIEIVIKYGLGFGLLAWVIWRYWSPDDGSPGLQDALSKPANYVPFVIAFVIFTVSVLITIVRWYILVGAQDLPFTFPNAIRLGFIGLFLSNFLPTSIGGDVIKAAFIAREQRRRTVAIATVLMDRAVGLCALFWLVALIGGWFWLTGSLHELTEGGSAKATAVTALQTIVLVATGLTALSILFWFLLGVFSEGQAQQFAGRLTKFPKVGHALAEFWRALWMYRKRSRRVAAAIGLSLVGHVGFVLTFYFSARTLAAVHDIPALGAQFLLVPVGMAIQAGVPFPGGVGGGELGFEFLFGLVDARFAKNGVYGSLVQRVITWLLGLIGYIVYLRMKPALRHAPQHAPELAVAER